MRKMAYDGVITFGKYKANFEKKPAKHLYTLHCFVMSARVQKMAIKIIQFRNKKCLLTRNLHLKYLKSYFR